MKQLKDGNDYSNINQNQIGPSSKVTLKSKIGDWSKAIDVVNDEFEKNISDIQAWEIHKETQEKELKENTNSMKQKLLVQLNKLEEEMKKHLSEEKDENVRLQKLITALKGEKTVWLSKLIALQRRISDMENHVGADDLKFI